MKNYLRVQEEQTLNLYIGPSLPIFGLKVILSTILILLKSLMIWNGKKLPSVNVILK